MGSKSVTFCILIILLGVCSALDNGLGRTPQMAWNSWNAFGCGINETLIKQIADAVISSGLHKLGFEYVNMDDCWAKSRNASGYVEADPVAFPSGIKALADYVHSLGLKFGLYSDAGTDTCAGRPGSLGYETQDAEQYAAWGVDYLKYDNCNNEGLVDPPRYHAMRDALNKTGRPIFFSMCDWVVTTAEWGADTGNSWRTTTDIQPYFTSWTNNLDQSNIAAQYAAPGGFNDPDMLEVGNGDLTDDQNMAHYSLWALVKAPLILGNDLRQIPSTVYNVLSNLEVIGISQDPLGIQGVKLSLVPAADNKTVDTLIYADTCTGSPAQQFISNNGTIKSVLTGGCFGQFAQPWNCNSASMGAMTYLQPCGSDSCKGKLQKYSVPSTANSPFKTNFVVGDPLCVQTVSRDNSVQADVVLWNCTGSANQQWSFDNGALKQNGLCLTVAGGAEVWAGKLSDGSFAVALFNRALVSQTVTVSWKQLGFSGEATVRDLWAHSNLGSFLDSFSSSVNPQGIAFIKVAVSSK